MSAGLSPAKRGRMGTVLTTHGTGEFSDRGMNVSFRHMTSSLLDRRHARPLAPVIVLFGLLIALASVSAGAEENLLKNPGFEEVVDGRLAGWTYYVTRGSAAGFQISAESYAGEYAAMIDIAAALHDSDETVARLAFTQSNRPVAAGGDLEPGATYKLSVYYRTEGDPRGRLMVQVRNHRPFPNVRLPASSEWTYAELEFEFPETGEWASMGLWANYESSENASGKIWFDEVRLVKVVPETEAPMEELDAAVHEQGNAGAQVIRVRSTSELIQAVARARAGYTILLADGLYEGNQAIPVHGKHGTADHPIVIAAENIGKAEIGGRLQFDIRDSSYIVLRGMKFTTTGEPVLGGSGSGAVVISDSSHVRVTRNHFALTEEHGALRMKNWVRLQGSTSHYNRIDHNLFDAKVQLGNYIVLHVANDHDNMPRHTRIDHNHFRDMLPIGRNGMEAIRVGNIRYMSKIDSGTIIEYNLFERTDGERAEIISIKNSSNIIRYNTFLESDGSLTLRYGDRNWVYGNYFIGNNKAGAGGVRIYGKDHRVFNNYFQGLGRPAISIGSGNADDVMDLDETGYIRVERVHVVYNTFVDNANSIAYHYRPDGYPLTPLDTLVANNVIYHSRASANPAISAAVDRLMELGGVTWENNVVHAPQRALTGVPDGFPGFRIVDQPLVLGLDGVYYPPGDSPLIDAGSASLDYLTTDIEGKPRDAFPDIGAFEYAGTPLVRGPLTPDLVGPYGPEDLSYDPDKPLVKITAIDMDGVRRPGSGGWAGPITVVIDGVALGTEPPRVSISVDGATVHEGIGFPVKAAINRGELDEGKHQLTVLVEASDPENLRDERIVPFIVENIAISSPSLRQPIQGEVPLAVEIALPEEVIMWVTVAIDGRELFSGPRLPEKLVLNTREFADGEHKLRLEAVRTDGRTSSASWTVRIANQWEIRDALLPPQNWGSFGFIDQLKTSETSAGWKHVSDRPSDFFGDADRLARQAATAEYLVWKAPNLQVAEVTLYSRSSRIEDQIAFLVSSDGRVYEPLLFDSVRSEPSPAGWHQYVLRADVPETAEVQFFKFQIKAGDLGPDDIQIGEVLLRGRN